MPKYVACVLVAVLLVGTGQANTTLSDEEIAQRLIAQSIANYPGNCPCPYHRARNGSACGKRSAYSKPGGYSPLCYRSDVTDAMIREYRENVRE